MYSLFFGSFEVNQKVLIEQWNTVSTFLQPLSKINELRVKRYLRQHAKELGVLQLWSYSFSGAYTPSSFVDAIAKWPSKSYIKVTVLEGRSIYDIDDVLTKKWLISSHEYISAVSDASIIQKFAQKYTFVQNFMTSKPKQSSLTLEGLLYPDTYHVNPNQSIVDQLISLQLAAFRDKVAVPYSSQIESFSDILRWQWYSFSLGFYNIIALASIIEKEERSNVNKPTIASLFLNRIEGGMRLDADITLCYGLQQWYENCTPDLIARSVADSTNLYNTRTHTGITPTPISNPSQATIKALLFFEKTDYLFYLHDSAGHIWYAKDLQWHNINKSKYL